MPRDYLGTVKLRNEYRVYKSDVPKLYIIRGISPRQAYENNVYHDNVLALYKALKGKPVTVNDVLDAIEEGSVTGLSLRTYGYKRRYEVQDILVVLCALGLADVEKERRGFVYTIHVGSPPAYN